MSEPHLRLTKVHRHYGKGETEVRVLDAADLEVMSGELVAIVAPSGAGKSTLLHLSGLLEKPQAGEIEITGTPTFALSERGRELGWFLLVNAGGMLIAVGTLAVSHYVLDLTSPLADNIAANGVGLALGTAFRYVCYRYLVFTGKPVTP